MGTAIMRRNTMSDHEHETSEMSFDCCGARTDERTTPCACGSTMRKHPFVTFAVCTFMGLALLLIPAGAILGIIAFLRTI